jgi:hypothetical protein
MLIQINKLKMNKLIKKLLETHFLHKGGKEMMNKIIIINIRIFISKFKSKFINSKLICL